MKTFRRYGYNRRARTGARTVLQTVLILAGCLGIAGGFSYLHIRNQKELERKRAVWEALRIELYKEARSFQG